MPAIARYGVRYIPGSTQSGLAALERGQGVDGPQIREFEKRFAEYQGIRHAVTASYGRMAFYYILRAFDFPKGSEIIFPALTFWVVPEIARVCGLRPVFVDIQSDTYNLDPFKIEAAITPRTCAVVPTHLYGQPCDMDPIMEIAYRHDLKVIEDCAHALGATYHNRRTGTFGDAALFSFQMLKGLNAYGGGMATTNTEALGEKIRNLVESERWPSGAEVRKQIQNGELLRAILSPYGFTLSLFLGFYLGSFLSTQDLSRYLWETIRPLNPLPDSYRRRFSNAQAVIALKGLAAVDERNARCRANAAQLTEGLRSIPSIITPAVVPDTMAVYYQYCIRSSQRVALSRRAIRRGVDVEIMHMNICNTLPLFAEFHASCPVAESTENTMQLPVYSSLHSRQVARVVKVIRKASENLQPLDSDVATRQRH